MCLLCPTCNAEQCKEHACKGDLYKLFGCTAVGFWGASNSDAVAAECTEVTPSGLRPPRGHSLTPVAQLPSTGLPARLPADCC